MKKRNKKQENGITLEWAILNPVHRGPKIPISQEKKRFPRWEGRDGFSGFGVHSDD